MKEVIDLYAKLVIGTFSFIGPSFTLFISLFYQALQKSTEKHQSQFDTLVSLKSSNSIISDLIKSNRKELNLLNPKRQVRRLFIGLFLSLGLIFFYYFQHSHFWPYESLIIRAASIILSGLFFIYCIIVLWQVFCIIITTKSEEGKDDLIRKTPTLKTI
jgi:hypothetical protein